MTDFSVVEEASGVEPNVDNKTISSERLKAYQNVKSPKRERNTKIPTAKSQL